MASDPKPASATYERSDNPSATALLSRLLEDATALVRSELALARTELMETATSLRVGIVSMAMGTAVLVTGILTLVAAAVLGLAELIDPWLAALLIGVLLACAGAVMVRVSKKKLTGPDVKLDQTGQSLRKDAALAARRTS